MSNSENRVVTWCVTPHASRGWAPITEMAKLIGRLTGAAPRFIHPQRNYSLARAIRAFAPRVAGERADLLLIASHPGDLLTLGSLRAKVGGFRTVHAWIIDAFWTDRLPSAARSSRLVDHVWVPDAELVPWYQEQLQVPCGLAPWGTDALKVTQTVRDREIDVLRLGRQPHAWADDESNRRALKAAGLSYQGRFPVSEDPAASQAAVIGQLARSKLVLASGNLASPAPYTHPRRDYITARFTDAMATGTLIAGKFPECSSADLIAREARVTMDISTHEAGLEAVVEGVERWSPRVARRLQVRALRTLDWRHRIRAIVDAMGAEVPMLTTELEQVEARADQLEGECDA